MNVRPDLATAYLHRLCFEIDNRRVGSHGNQEATAFFAERLAAFGFGVERTRFDCMDWEEAGASLSAGSQAFEVFPSPYSPGGRFEGRLVTATSAAELMASDLGGAIALLAGEVAREQLMPKNFPFYNPEEHRQIITLLEREGPLAIIAATSRNPEVAGAVYPFPLFEDGDFDIPSVYMTADEGRRLMAHAGDIVRLESRARRIHSWGENVAGRRGDGSGGRIVFCAHIDAKIGTPGALDNGAGIVTLLLLAEMLAGHEGRPEVELVAFNGEDYYAASGEIAYLAQNQGRLDHIRLSVNIDGAGFSGGEDVFSLYGCPDEVAAAVRESLAGAGGLAEGPSWFQSDHMIFAQNGVPAVAITTAEFAEFQGQIAHTAADTPEVVDVGKLAALAGRLRRLVGRGVGEWGSG